MRAAAQRCLQCRIVLPVVIRLGDNAAQSSPVGVQHVHARGCAGGRSVPSRRCRPTSASKFPWAQRRHNSTCYHACELMWKAICCDRGLQTLGLAGLGMSSGFERLHYLLESAFDADSDLSPAFLKVRT